MSEYTQAADATVDDHLRSMIGTMKRGARVSLTDIPDDPTFLSSHFGGDTAKAMAEKIESAVGGEEFLHRLIENAFSWALRDCNYLSPKYMDRLIAETRAGMKPEQAATWNATAKEQADRKAKP